MCLFGGEKLSMKLSIMQPYFLPYIGYFQLINHADKFVILDDVQYIKSGWINRNYILQIDKPLLFTVPVSKLSSKSLISDTTVMTGTGRITKFLKSVHLNYYKAPYFENVFSILTKIFETKHKNISHLNYFAINEVMKYLKIETEIVRSSSVYENRQLKGEIRIIDICKKENAAEYINLSGGQELYSKKNFRENGINLKFIKSKEIKYRQFKENFTAPLSVIDNLMFNSPEEVKKSLFDIEIF